MKHIMHSRYKRYNKVFGSIAMFIFNNNVISFTELIWSQVKGYVARKNVRSRPLKDMKELVWRRLQQQAFMKFSVISNIKLIWNNY